MYLPYNIVTDASSHSFVVYLRRYHWTLIRHYQHFIQSFRSAIRGNLEDLDFALYFTMVLYANAAWETVPMLDASCSPLTNARVQSAIVTDLNTSQRGCYIAYIRNTYALETTSV